MSLNNRETSQDNWKELATKLADALLSDKNENTLLTKQQGPLHPDNLKASFNACESIDQLTVLLLTGLTDPEYFRDGYTLNHHIVGYGSRDTLDAYFNLLTLMAEHYPKHIVSILKAQEVYSTSFNFSSGKTTIFGSTLAHSLMPRIWWDETTDVTEFVKSYLDLLFKLKDKLNHKTLVDILAKRTLGGNTAGHRMVLKKNKEHINQYVCLLVSLLTGEAKAEVINLIKLDDREHTLSNDDSKEIKDFFYRLNESGFANESKGLKALTDYFSGNLCNKETLQNCYDYLMNPQVNMHFKSADFSKILLSCQRNNGITLCHLFINQLDSHSIDKLFTTLVLLKGQSNNIIKQLFLKIGNNPALADLIIRRQNAEITKQYIAFVSALKGPIEANELHYILKNSKNIFTKKEIAEILFKNLSHGTFSKEACHDIAFNYKDILSQHLLTLPDNEAKELVLKNALNSDHPLGQILWYQRGWAKPSLKSGNLNLLNQALNKLQAEKLPATEITTKTITKTTSDNLTVQEIPAWATTYPHIYSVINPAFTPAAVSQKAPTSITPSHHYADLANESDVTISTEQTTNHYPDQKSVSLFRNRIIQTQEGTFFIPNLEENNNKEEKLSEEEIALSLLSTAPAAQSDPLPLTNKTKKLLVLV